MKNWKLRKGADRRFNAGHPWVYSNELAESPKGTEPGELIELQDPSGKFLARGYGNPHSLIAFRTLTRDQSVVDPGTGAFLLQQLTRAWDLRARTGLETASFRLCFGESDGIPGLVIDRYVLTDGSQVFATQAHTAGVDRLQPALFEAIERLVKERGGNWEKTAIVAHNDLSVRKLEGLQPEEARVIKAVAGMNLSRARIRLRSGLELDADLQGGQKTGFFLDQAANVAQAGALFARLKPAKGALKILDLCTYVGQWGAHLARDFRAQGLEVEVTAVDASETALAFARGNIERQGARCTTLKGDVLKDLASLDAGSFDLVVCDPPALIKGRKDIPQGTHAYLQLNTQVFRLVRPDGAVVSCSCSALLEEESLLETLAKAARRNQRTVRWVGRGAQAPDHPVLAEFPEGRYLKAFFGWA